MTSRSVFLKNAFKKNITHSKKTHSSKFGERYSNQAGSDHSRIAVPDNPASEGELLINIWSRCINIMLFL